MQVTLKTLQQQTFKIDIDPEETVCAAGLGERGPESGRRGRAPEGRQVTAGFVAHNEEVPGGQMAWSSTGPRGLWRPRPGARGRGDGGGGEAWRPGRWSLA